MSSNGKSRRRLRRRLAFAAVAVALSLLVAELGLRLVAHATGRDRGVVQDDVLGWRMVPDLVKSGETWCADVPARTNSRGWRDAEPAPTRPPGTRRILALGDSMTFGANVDYGQRFTEHLEDDRTEVLNLAACGYGTDQQVLLYEHEGRDYAADVVMLLVTPYNDLDDIRCSRLGGWSKPWFTIEDDGLRLHRDRGDWTEWLRSRSYVVELVLQVLQHGRPARQRAAAWRSGNPLPLFAALVDRLRAAVDADGARLLVVFERLEDETPPDLVVRAARMRAAVEQQGIATFEVVFDLPPQRRPELHLPCGHWSPLAHQLVARQLGAELARRGW